MALATSLTGAGQVTSENTDTRQYTTERVINAVTGATKTVLMQEVTYKETRVWYSLTDAASAAVISANDQPVDPDQTYNWSRSLTSREINSYDVQREWTYKVITESNFTTNTADVTFTPDSSAQPAGTVSVQLDSTDTDAIIYYETDAVDADSPTFDSTRVFAGSSVSVPVPGNIKAFAITITKPVSNVTQATYTAA